MKCLRFLSLNWYSLFRIHTISVLSIKSTIRNELEKDGDDTELLGRGIQCGNPTSTDPLQWRWRCYSSLPPVMRGASWNPMALSCAAPLES